MIEKAKGALGLVPKLRFPEFRDDGAWTVTPLRQLCVPISEKVGNAKLTPVSITAGKGFVSQASKFGRDISGEQYRNYTYLRKGDFAYNKGNSTVFQQGYVCQLTEFDEAAASSAFLCFRLNDEHQPRFVQALFDQNVHGRQLASFITSGARSNGLLNIRSDDFYGVKMPLPPKVAEQRKIADCLSSLDTLIATEAEKLAALRDHKKGLMHHLFPAEGETTPRLRFPEFRDAGEWSMIPAGHLFSNRVERGNATLPLYSVTMNDGLLPRASLDRKIGDIGNPNANKFVRKGDIAYNMMRMWQGALGASPEDCMVSPAYIVLEPKSEANAEFLVRLLKLPKTLRSLREASRGLTEDRLRLYFDDFAKVKLLCPSIPEQEQIADCLSHLDSSISAQSDRIDALKADKFGLTQQLFPSPAEVDA